MTDQPGRDRAAWRAAIWRDDGWDRDELGRFVRAVWNAWAARQPGPVAPSPLDWEALNEIDREGDREIGEAVARIAVSSLIVNTFGPDARAAGLAHD